MKEITAYECDKCKEIYKDKAEAIRCCKCRFCKYYIGRFNKTFKWVHCMKGYTCDSYDSQGKNGKFSEFEDK